ncbi:MAG: WD40/YVTN/BNR-like repeat-containing protein, partial [Anaerolineae bacterium]
MQSFKSFITISLTLICASLLLALPAMAQKLDMDKLKGMKARSIGPAGMSGRVSAIDAVNSNPDIIYVGTASGGLWKSTSGGIAWKPIFDDQPVASIGAVAIDQSNPDVIWVGTGEGNPRNSQTNGNGVYKSIDGGQTWTHLGLDNSRSIHRILINPQNPDIVYLGVMGAAWGENPERGVYKTADGGKTWTKILYIDEKTGVADLVMDPSNPNKLIAAMWEYRRWPWFFNSGGPGSGIHVTFDGGDNWEKRTADVGLPEGEFGRIGLAIAPSAPNMIYALIEAKKNALYGSKDGGFKWNKITDKNVSDRPFYYQDIFVDPTNENRIYHVHSRVSMSEDGGKSFKEIVPFNRVHPDHHAWWIHPGNPNLIMDGNDGGMAISRDRAKTWRFVENLPLAQLYHINVDMETPYNVMGGMQDNGSWRGPNTVWRAGGIRNSYWEEVAFGDGFDVVPDQSNPRYGYAMSQGGNLRRFDLLTGEQKLIKPPHPDNMPLRFNWNAGIAADPFSPTTIYYGSQFLHKSANRGDSWKII